MDRLINFLVPVVFADGNFGLVNPLKVKSIQELVTTILGVVVQISAPIVALYIMYAGFLYVAARGNDAKLQKAHQALTYSLIGAALVLGAFVVVTVLQGTINSLK